jgi:hypothetical protein
MHIVSKSLAQNNFFIDYHGSRNDQILKKRIINYAQDLKKTISEENEYTIKILNEVGTRIQKKINRADLKPEDLNRYQNKIKGQSPGAEDDQIIDFIKCCILLSKHDTNEEKKPNYFQVVNKTHSIKILTESSQKCAFEFAELYHFYSRDKTQKLCADIPPLDHSSFRKICIEKDIMEPKENSFRSYYFPKKDSFLSHKKNILPPLLYSPNTHEAALPFFRGKNGYDKFALATCLRKMTMQYVSFYLEEGHVVAKIFNPPYTQEELKCAPYGNENAQKSIDIYEAMENLNSPLLTGRTLKARPLHDDSLKIFHIAIDHHEECAHAHEQLYITLKQKLDKNDFIYSIKEEDAKNIFKTIESGENNALIVSCYGGLFFSAAIQLALAYIYHKTSLPFIQEKTKFSVQNPLSSLKINSSLFNSLVLHANKGYGLNLRQLLDETS